MSWIFAHHNSVRSITQLGWDSGLLDAIVDFKEKETEVNWIHLPFLLVLQLFPFIFIQDFQKSRRFDLSSRAVILMINIIYFGVKWAWVRKNEKHVYEAVYVGSNPYDDPVYTGMPLLDLVYTGIPLGDTSEYLRGTLEQNWRNAEHCSLHLNTTGKNLVETAPHWNATGETPTIVAYTGTPLEGLRQLILAWHRKIVENKLHWKDSVET